MAARDASTHSPHPRRGGLGRVLARAFGALVVLVAGATLACGDASSSETMDTAAGVRPGELRVAVAANFADAFDAIARRFEASRPGVRVTSIVGSTGALVAQIDGGAPFDILLAADAERPAKLEALGRVVPGSRFTYARGRLALTGRHLQADADLARALSHPDVRHVAVANPSTAPYGAAALDALAALGLAETLRPRLVFGNDVGQAMQFVDSGAASLGFCALAQLVLRDDLPRVLVPETLHAPILQDAALLRDGADARALLDFLRGDEAADVLRTFGYGVHE